MEKNFFKASRIMTIIASFFRIVLIGTLLLRLIIHIGYSLYLSIFYTMLILLLIASIIVNFMAVSKLKLAENNIDQKNKVLPWAIYLFFGAGIIASGLALAPIFMNLANEPVQNKLEHELTTLKKLRDSGLLTEEEYLNRKKIILSNL